MDHACGSFPNHFEHAVTYDCIDNYMFLANHSRNVLIHAMQSSYDHFYEDKILILDDQELISKEQPTQFFFIKMESLPGQLSFLNQHFSNHGYEDPTSILLE